MTSELLNLLHIISCCHPSKHDNDIQIGMVLEIHHFGWGQQLC